MKLLVFLEFIIAPIALWPRYVWEAMVLLPPLPQHVRKVAAFFYGHGVPVGVAFKVYEMCTRHTLLRTSVKFLFVQYYAYWHDSKLTPHQAQFFSPSQGRVLWINGSGLPQIINPVETGEVFYSYSDCRTIADNRLAQITEEDLNGIRYDRRTAPAFDLLSF